MKPPVGLDLIYLYTYLISKRALNLSKFMFDNRKIVIFPFGKGGGGEVKPPSGLEYVYFFVYLTCIQLTFQM